MIDTKLGRERTTIRSPATAIRRELEPLDVITDSQTRSTGGESQKKNRFGYPLFRFSSRVLVWSPSFEIKAINECNKEHERFV
jgi:hypothetical protein